MIAVKNTIPLEEKQMEKTAIQELIDFSGISNAILCDLISMDYNTYTRKRNGTQDKFTKEQEMSICSAIISHSDAIKKKSKKLFKKLAP